MKQPSRAYRYNEVAASNVLPPGHFTRSFRGHQLHVAVGDAAVLLTLQQPANYQPLAQFRLSADAFRSFVEAVAEAARHVEGLLDLQAG